MIDFTPLLRNLWDRYPKLKVLLTEGHTATAAHGWTPWTGQQQILGYAPALTSIIQFLATESQIIKYNPLIECVDIKTDDSGGSLIFGSMARWYDQRYSSRKLEPLLQLELFDLYQP